MILRLSLTITLAILSLASDGVSTPVSVTAAMLGCLIGSGFFTRSAAAASIVLIIVEDHNDLIALMSIAADAIALLLLGAGACSLDELVIRTRFSAWRDRA
ncbi:MAG: hypothetical protein WC729_14620 [Sphingomonas sp.]|uniref:hypothetical protein n=1 Tax=Sphingomonas sp. TaxID=28214 RepID=UPI00356ACFF9